MSTVFLARGLIKPIRMKQLLLVCAVLLSMSGKSYAQQAIDTNVAYLLPNVNVNTTRNWENDTIRYRYNQMKYYVTTILPYLNAAITAMNELNAKEQDNTLTKRQRKDFVNHKEDEITARYKKELSALNETQGVLLIKLIARQSGQNIYSKMEEYKNPFYAFKWQMWAQLHGFNLNKRYDPNDEPMLEHIMQSIGYPLPEVYGEYDAKLTFHR
jgi:hypothetical protein